MVKTQTKKFPPERCEHDDGALRRGRRRPEEARGANQPLPAGEGRRDRQGRRARRSVPPTRRSRSWSSRTSSARSARAPRTSRTKVKEKYGDKVRFVFRQFPLSFHQQAHLAAEAALAAHAQGKFWEYPRQAVRGSEQARAPRARGDREGARPRTWPTFKKALDDKTYAAAVDADMKLGEEVAVDGTPTMFLNGKRVADPTNFEAICQADRRRARQEGLRRARTPASGALAPHHPHRLLAMRWCISHGAC